MGRGPQSPRNSRLNSTRGTWRSNWLDGMICAPGSILSGKWKGASGVVQNERFLQAERGVRQNQEKSGLFQAKSPSLRGRRGGSSRQISSPVLTTTFQTNWFKMPLLGEVESVMKLSVLSWWCLARGIPFWACCFHEQLPAPRGQGPNPLCSFSS